MRARKANVNDKMINHIHAEGKVNTGFKVGFYGCNRQMVKIGFHQEAKGRAPQSFAVDCPACGRRHQVNKPMFRKAKSVEEFLLAEVRLEIPTDV